MRRILRSQLEQRAPTLFAAIRAIRHRRYFRRQFAELHAEVRRHLFPERTPITVQTGPFRGLRYFDETVWGSVTPKWLGSYEAELHPTIDHIASRGYAVIIDVGCAEGYYAAGLAMIAPTARVIAFDTDFISRRQAHRLAKLNGLSNRLRVRTYCDHADLDALSVGATLVVCDIEGFETQLLDPTRAAALVRDDILVEVHETSEGSRAVEDLLRARFEATHRIQRIVAIDRDRWIAEHRPRLWPDLPVDTIRRATEESRATGRVWLWMQAHSPRP